MNFSNLLNSLNASFEKLESGFDKFVDKINFVPKKQGLFKFIITFLIFLFSFYLIQRDNTFFSGDMGVIGLITKDYQSGVFRSWYFYGQSYYGNLENFVLAFLTLFSGISVKSLYFWEHFFYFISVFTILLNIKNLRLWQMVLYPSIMFFATRFYEFTFFPQGFAFVTMIIILSYHFTNKFYLLEMKKVSLFFFVVGMLSAFSFWHYPIYVFLAPVVILLYIVKLFQKELKFKSIHLFSIISGFGLGILPMIFATLQTNYENLSQFSSNSTNLEEKISFAIFYYIRDFFYYFLNADSLSSNSTIKDVLVNFFTVRNLYGFSILLICLFFIALYLKKIKTNLVAFLFLLAMLFLLIYRGIPSMSSGLFGVVRYGVPFYVLLYFIVLKEAHSALYLKNFKNLFSKFASIYLIFAFCLFSISNVFNKYAKANQADQIYDLAIEDIKSENVQYIYCEDYYQICGAIAFIEEDINVEIINYGKATALRNPQAVGETEKAEKNGIRVLSLVKKKRVHSSDTVLNTYGDRYYLIEGRFKNHPSN